MKFTNGTHYKWERQTKVGHERFYVCSWQSPKWRNVLEMWRLYLKCKSRVITVENDSIIRELTEHSHPSNPARVAVAKSAARMRDQEVNSSEYTSNIIQSEAHAMSFTTAGVLPKITSLQRMVQRKRACPEGNFLIDEFLVTPRGKPSFSTKMIGTGFTCLGLKRIWIYWTAAPVGFMTVHLTLAHLVISCTRCTHCSTKIALSVCIRCNREQIWGCV